MEQKDPIDISSLTYATPQGGNSGLAAGVWITLAGLGLIFLGGCFCIGIMISLRTDAFVGLTNAPPVNTTGMSIFIALLYALAFACFGLGAWVMVLGIRKLIAIGR